MGEHRWKQEIPCNTGTSKSLGLKQVDQRPGTVELRQGMKVIPVQETELRFGYFYDGHWKIYRPFADKKNKWMPNNVPITMMDGMKDVEHCRLAFINKSKKDYMVMKKLYPHCCAVQNEGIGCFSPENVQYLKDNSDIQILSFDADITGVQNSQQITKLFGFGYCNVPRKFLSEGIKDWIALHGCSCRNKKHRAEKPFEHFQSSMWSGSDYGP